MTRSSSNTGFTLVEMIAVMIILGVIAAAIVPRITGSASRQAEVDARNIQRILSIAAERSSLWTQPVAIDFADDRLQLLSPRTTDPATPSSPPAKWLPDLLVEPVVLTRVKVRRATLDAQALKPAAWRATFNPSQPRPTIELEVGIPNQPDGWTISLSPDATAATRTSLPSAAPGVSQTLTDLDDAGRGTSKW